MQHCSLRRLSPIVIALTSLVVSCPSAPAESKPQESEDDAQPKLQILDWEESQKLIAGHEGKVVLVDIWTTTCGQCVESFPEFVALHERFKDKEFTCVSVNCDYDGVQDKPPEFYRPQVTEFLQQQDARFDHILLSVPFIDFLDEIKLDSTPAYLLYDAEGRLVRRFDNDAAKTAEDEFSLEDVAEAVGALVNEAQ